jgi:hypothetical protein
VVGHFPLDVPQVFLPSHGPLGIQNDLVAWEMVHVLMRCGPFLHDSPEHCLRIGIGETFPPDKLTVDLAGVPAVKPGSK